MKKKTGKTKQHEIKSTKIPFEFVSDHLILGVALPLSVVYYNQQDSMEATKFLGFLNFLVDLGVLVCFCKHVGFVLLFAL